MKLHIGWGNFLVYRRAWTLVHAKWSVPTRKVVFVDFPCPHLHRCWDAQPFFDIGFERVGGGDRQRLAARDDVHLVHL